MKRKQKRYTTEEEIIKEIDAKRQLAKECLEQALACDNVVESCLREIAELERPLELANEAKYKKLMEEIGTLKHKSKFHKDKAERLSKKRNRIENTTLPQFKNALAEFRTALMSYTDDPGVVLK